MKLVDLTLTDFVQTLGSDAPAPGGGSASALASAQGIALTEMVMNLSIGKKKYAEFEEELKEIHAKAADLKEKLLEAIDKDTEAFNDVSAVFSMPKSTDDEKAARKEAMSKALQGAAKTPLATMELTVAALEATKRAVGKSNTNAASDLGVAALNLNSGLQGSYLNVLINLPGIKDETFVKDIRQEAEGYLEKGKALAEEIYSEIESGLK